MPTRRAGIYCRGPRVQPAILVAVFRRIVIAIALFGFEVQVFRHPDLIADFHRLIGPAIAQVLERICGGIIFAASLLCRTATGSFAAVAVRASFDELLESGDLFAVVHTFDVFTDGIKFAVFSCRGSPLGNFFLCLAIVPLAVFCKIASELFHTLFKRRYAFITLHHHAHGKQSRVVIARLENIQVFKLRKFTVFRFHVKCGKNFFFGQLLCIGKRRFFLCRQVHHAFVFQFREQVDVHVLAILQIGQRMERELVRRLFPGQFIEVITRHLEHGTRRGQINILDFKVALVALDFTFEHFARQCHRLAINTLHRHSGTLCKRTFLRKPSHIQVRDDSRIFRGAASSLITVGTRDKKHRHNSKRNKSTQMADRARHDVK